MKSDREMYALLQLRRIHSQLRIVRGMFYDIISTSWLLPYHWDANAGALYDDMEVLTEELELECKKREKRLGLEVPIETE